MHRRTIYFIINAMVPFLLLGTASCQRPDDKISEMVYAIKPNSKFRIYGIEIDKILSKRFSEIEQDLDAKTVIDKKASVISITKERNFVLKIRGQILNAVKDRIDISYGPVEGLSLNKNPGSVLPRSIVFHGVLAISEPVGTKQTIIRELEENLPHNGAAKDILDKINHDFLLGNYSKSRRLKVNFEMPGYTVAYFYITFSDNLEIIYRYVFSRSTEVYPDI
ncbi:MAG TPA: hypothetical protein VLX29_08635 [Nitrospirota bacterium]|nr:hypothetical protein [Nitrospirota bacterium]